MNQNSFINYFDAIASASSGNPICEASLGQWAQAKEARLLDFIAKAASVQPEVAVYSARTIENEEDPSATENDGDQYLEILYPINEDAATWVKVNVDTLSAALDSETDDIMVEVETISGPVLLDARDLMNVINDKVTALDAEAAMSAYLATLSAADSFSMTEFMDYCEARGYNYTAYVQKGLIEQYEGFKPGDIFKSISSGLDQLKEKVINWNGIELPVIDITNYLYTPGSSIVVNTAVRLGTGLQTVTTVGAFLAVVVGGIAKACQWLGDRISGFFEKILDDTTSFINVNSLAEACGSDLPIFYVRVKDFKSVFSLDFVSQQASTISYKLEQFIATPDDFNGQCVSVIDATHGELLGYEPLYGATMEYLRGLANDMLMAPGYYTFPIDGNNVLIATNGTDVVFAIFATEYSVDQINSSTSSFNLDDLYITVKQRRNGLRNPSTDYQDMACLLNCFCEGDSGDYETSALHHEYYEDALVSKWITTSDEQFAPPPTFPVVGQRKQRLLRDIQGIPGLNHFFTIYGQQCADEISWRPWLDVDPNTDNKWRSSLSEEEAGHVRIFGPTPTDFYQESSEHPYQIDYDQPRPWSRDVSRFLPCAPSFDAVDLGNNSYSAVSIKYLPDLVHGPGAIGNYFSPFYLDTERDVFITLPGRSNLLIRSIFATLALYATYTSRGRAFTLTNPEGTEPNVHVGRFSSGVWYTPTRWITTYSEPMSTTDMASLIYLPYTTNMSLPQYSYHIEDFSEYTKELARLVTAISVTAGAVLAVSAMMYFRVKLTPKMVELDRAITKAKVDPNIPDSEYLKLVKKKRKLLKFFGWLLPASVTAGAVGGNVSGSIADTLESLLPSEELTDSEKLALIYKILTGKSFDSSDDT